MRSAGLWALIAYMASCSGGLWKGLTGGGGAKPKSKKESIEHRRRVQQMHKKVPRPRALRLCPDYVREERDKRSDYKNNSRR